MTDVNVSANPMAYAQAVRVDALQAAERTAGDARAADRVGVVGAGTMGRGIVLALLRGGCEVVWWDVETAALTAGEDWVRATCDADVTKGRMDAAQARATLAMLRAAPGLEAMRDTDLIIEAVIEDMDVKRALFTRLDGLLGADAVLATNTSTLDVDALAACTGRAEQVVGLHFFSPAHVMKLIEVVRGRATRPTVLAQALALALRLGKVPVVSAVCDGFIGNRVLAPYVRMAHALVEYGASPLEVDRALEDWGMAMGPLRMGDLVGNDVGWAIRRRRDAARGGPPPARFADHLCELGRFGQKRGAGWYRYAPGSREALPDPDVDALLDAYRTLHGITPRHFSTEEIVDRCVISLIDEAARVVEEGIARCPGDVDLVFLTGYGFPAVRGGPLHEADQRGADAVVQRIEVLASMPGPGWSFVEPAPLLLRLARDGGLFGGL